MKMCEKHWQDLKAALDRRGLTQFIAENADEVAKRLKAEKGFEPLAQAWIAIAMNAIDADPRVMMAKENAEACPLCELPPRCKCGRGDECEFSKWIEFAAEEQLDEAKRLGLVAAA